MDREARSGPSVSYQGSLVILGQTRFSPHDETFRREGVADVWPNVAFPRAPLGIRHADGDLVLGDANTAILFTVGRPYRRFSISGRGSWTEWIEIRPEVLADMVLEHEPRGTPDRTAPFRAGGAPVSGAAYLAHRRLRTGLEGTKGGDALALEETALSIVGDVLASGFAVHGGPRNHRPAHSERVRRRVVYHVQALLNRDLAEPLRLAEISAAVEISPYHLCRVFREGTGVPIHRYRDWLRVRASLERVAERRARILDIAIDLGYASEAHFSEAFRRAFGVRPGKFRRIATRALVEECSRRAPRPVRVDS